MISPLELLLFAALCVIAGAVIADGRDGSTDPVTDALEERRQDLRGRYQDGELSLEAFEAQVVLLERPGTETIMRDAVGVEGIGPHRAFAIARTFEGDVEAYRSAPAARFERVNGVGPNRARALASRHDRIDLETAQVSDMV